MLNVIQPSLDLAIVGPKLRYLDRKGVYTLKVSNPGDAPASNVFLTETIPAGFKFIQADNGGQLDEASRTIKWFIGELAAGQSRDVKCEFMAIAQGEFTHKATAHASRGIKAEHDLKTVIEGLSAILMEVVDIEDPVEVGGETAYEIKVTNTGSKAETDVKLVCTIPPQLKLKNVDSPIKYEVVGNDVVFQSLAHLAPRRYCLSNHCDGSQEGRCSLQSIADDRQPRRTGDQGRADKGLCGIKRERLRIRQTRRASSRKEAVTK